jgi:GNAT superfamily N-acetyltransferase
MASVHVVDPSDPSAFEEFYAVYAGSYTRPFDGPWLAVEKKVNLTDDEYGRRVAFLARNDDGVAVGGSTAVMPLQDNDQFVFVDVFVLPEHRRAGHGTALLEAALDAGRSHGRSTALGEPAWSIHSDQDAGTMFAEMHGFRLDLLYAVRELVLPATLPALHVDSGYTLETWRGPCPEEWVDQYADLRRIMNQEAPNGEAGLENEHWDAARVRKDEAGPRPCGA